MKEMIYFGHPVRDILAEGEIDGIQYVALNLGTHPAGYVRLPRGTIIDIMDIPCHGGITYCDIKLQVNSFKVRDGFWIGWDYAHLGDYSGYFKDAPGHKWKTEEIVEDCREVIAYLKSIGISKEEENESSILDSACSSDNLDT